MMHQDTDRVWRQLLTLRHLLVEEMQAGLTATAALDLTVVQSIALFRIAEAGPLGIGALQQRLARSQSATSYLVQQLERRGLVIRERDPTDGRRSLVALSPGGIALVGQIQALRHQAFEATLSRLPESVVTQLHQAFEATIEALKEVKS